MPPVEEPSNPSRLPWRKNIRLIPKPVEPDYGYVQQDKAVGCSREQLIEACSREGSDIHHAWCPEHPHIVTIYEVPELFDVVRDRRKTQLKSGLNNALMMAAVFGGLWWYLGFATQSLVFLLFIVMGVLPVLQYGWQFLRLRNLTREEVKGWVESMHYESWVAGQKAWTTTGLIVVLVLLFLLQLWNGLTPSIRKAGLDKIAIEDGEIWTILSGTLLHGGVIHMLFNGAALHWLGRPIEILAGRWAMLQVFTVSMLTGAAFSIAIGQARYSVGASGGIIGLLGFLVVFGIRFRHQLPNGFTRTMAANVVLIACVGIAGWQIIDNAGHLGGFVGGLLWSLLIVPRSGGELPLKESPFLRSAGWAAVVYLAVAVTITVLLLVQ